MKPKVRFLDIQPYGDKFLLRDPVGISPTFIVSPELVFILSFLDGSKDLRDLQVEIFRKTGQIVNTKDLEEIIKFLDENFLLYNERFLKKLEEERRNLLEKGVREPSHAGEAYPNSPEELKSFIEKQLSYNLPKTEAKGIIVPHMDLRVAGKVYGKVYSLIRENKYDVVLLLGVSHYFHEKPFSVLPLDLKTPLGILSVDRERIKTLSALFDYNIFHDILAYKQEHSIEFQAIFLKYLFPDIRVIPAIVSYGDIETLKDIANKLTEILKDAKNPLVISSVDFSHVGRKFGDPSSYDPSFRDREYIKLLSELKNEEAFELLEGDKNKTRIDGQFTNFVFLEVIKKLGAEKGELVDYEIYEEKPTDSKVSYAGLVFS